MAILLSGNLAITIIKGPLEALAGVAFGVLFGVIAWYLPNVKQVRILNKGLFPRIRKMDLEN